MAGLTIDEARKHIREKIKFDDGPQLSVELAIASGLQPIAGEHLVAPDGTVYLGSYGSVYVAGMTLDEATTVINQRLSESLSDPHANVSVFAYNSKVYYIITKGPPLGDTVARFPITGNETVLDALTRVTGLSRIAKKHIWIARPTADEAGGDVILPVNWQEIYYRRRHGDQLPGAAWRPNLCA